MKLSSAGLVLAALCDAVAATANARVFTYDPESQPRANGPLRELDPVSARLVLAQRSGVEEYHESDLGKREVIDAINDFGFRSPLFSETKSSLKKVLIMVEGVADPIGSMPSLVSYAGFEVSSLPSAASSRGLFVDLTKQMDPANFADMTDEDVLSTVTEFNHFSAHMDMAHHTTSMSDFEALFNRLVQQRHWVITVLITPPTVKSHDTADSADWGLYEMPTQQSLWKRRSTVKEQPLTETSHARPVSTHSAPISLAANSSVLRGILPACFHTQAECERRTQNCTGHGKCSLKYHDKTAPVAYDCYSCACSTTKSENGKITNYWGGPACQKKDISVQFWLIVLFTVGLIFVIGFAVGSVWEMGNEELPSVIGAGVSGPTARK